MHTNDIDAFFHMASHGDKEAYKTLYGLFVERANKLVTATIKRNSNFRGFPGDFCGLIDELFLKAINDYETEKGTFSTFVNWLLDRRLRNAVLQEIIEIQAYTKTIDYADIDYDEIETLPDSDSMIITDQIALNDFKLKISTPNVHKTQDERQRDRVLLLNYAGYKMVEISQILNMSYSTVKRILDKAREDEDLYNIKLDLK